MSVANIRAAIKAKLEAALDTNKVHDYERYAKDNAGMKALYKYDNRINGWNFSRVTTAEEDLNNGQVRRIHLWRANGFMGLDDADETGKLFDAAVELITAAFRIDPTLGGACLACKNLEQEFGESGIQVEEITPVMFAGVLCHRARLRLITEEEENIV